MGSFGEVVNKMIKDQELDPADGTFGTWSSPNSVFTVGRCDYQVVSDGDESTTWSEDGEEWNVQVCDETFKIFHI